MRIKWAAAIFVVLFVCGCSRTRSTDGDKGNEAAAPSQEGGVSGSGGASSGGSGGGNAGSGGYSGGGGTGGSGGSWPSGGSGGGTTGGTGGGTGGVGGGGTGGGGTGGSDAGPADAGLDGSPTEFCTGVQAHMIANGIDSSPAVSGTMLPLNCCDAAEFSVVTQTFAHFIVVSWRAQVGATSLPATIDLANPPQGWIVEVYVDCEPMQGTCNPAPDSYTTGLQGTLQVARSNTGYDMTLCLNVAESVDSPHPILHSLRLYAPNVTTTY